MVRPPYRPDDDPMDLDSTQPNPTPTQPYSPQPHLPPAPAPPSGSRGHVRATNTRRRRDKRKNDEARPLVVSDDEAMIAAERRSRRRVRTRGDSGLYLPAWSVMLMLVAVFAIAALIVFLVVYLGGNAAPGGEPRVVIITAVPSDTPAAGADAAALPTLDLGSNASGPLPTFALEGPLLPTIPVSPTPTRINIGSTVRVVNVGTTGLSVREAAGTTNERLFVAQEGDTFLIIDGPESIDNLTWWRLRASDNTERIGWAVENDGEQDVLEVASVPQ